MLYGGPTFSIHQTVIALVNSGIAVDVLTTNANGSEILSVSTDKFVKYAEKYRVRYFKETISNRFSWDFLRSIRHYIPKYDVIHLQDIFSTYALLTIVYSKKYKKPLIISPRGVFSKWAINNNNRFIKIIFIKFIHLLLKIKSSKFIWHATSQIEKKEILALFPRENVEIIPNGVDIQRYGNGPKLSRNAYIKRYAPSLQRSKGGLVLASMGRLHRKKCFDIVIKSIHHLRNIIPELVLLIAGGDDGERSILEKMILDLGLSDSVVLVGEIYDQEKINFLKGADAFLFPSYSENFGNVCLEALAAGVPVIASQNTPWEILSYEGAGWCVPNDINSFANAISLLARSNLDSMKISALRVAKFFDIDSVAVKFKTIYLELKS